MRKFLFLLMLVLIPSMALAAAKDIRISDDDGDVLNINSDGSVDISGGSTECSTSACNLNASTTINSLGICDSAGNNCVGTTAGGWVDGGTNVYATATGDVVGIGTTTPGTNQALTIWKPSGTDGSTAPLFTIRSTDNGTWTAQSKIGGVEFNSSDTNGSAGNRAGIYGIMEDTVGADAGLAFYTTTNGNTNYAEAMRIDNAGNVGIGTTNVLGRLSIGNARTHYVGCSDDIATIITAATAGDTLVLGSCTYSISASLGTISKALKIVGQGKNKTIIDAGANVITNLLASTADGLQVENLSILGTRISVVLEVDLTAGTSTSGVNNVFRNLYIDAKNSSGKTTGINLQDTGAVIESSNIIVGGSEWNASEQSYGVIEDTHSTTDVDTYLRINNSEIFNISSDAVGTGNTNNKIRGFRFYNYLNGDNPNNMYLYVNNSAITAYDRASPSNSTEACHMQGARIFAYLKNSSCDGDARVLTNSSSETKKDLRCEDGATCTLNNVSLVGNIYSSAAGTLIREGQLSGSSIILSAGNSPGLASDGVAAVPLISATGTTGGVGIGTTSASGGAGSLVSVTAGTGGAASSATVTGTGGAGGAYTLTAGTGAAQTTATATTNIGGAGGVLGLYGGTGGAASGAATTNTGAPGGKVYISGGAGGVGTTTTGANGDVLLGYKNGVGAIGNVGIGTSTTSATLSLFGGIAFSNAALLNVTSDDYLINAASRTYFKVKSDSSTAANRDLLLSNPVTTPGAMVILEYDQIGSNRVEILDDAAAQTSGNVRLKYNWLPFNDGETLILISNGVDWVEIGRSEVDTVASYAVTAAATIFVSPTNCSQGMLLINSSGTVTTNTTNTFTTPSSANAGCCIDVINDGANQITLDNNANFKSAGAADVVLGASDTVRVCSTGASGAWYQIGATGNN